LTCVPMCSVPVVSRITYFSAKSRSVLHPQLAGDELRQQRVAQGGEGGGFLRQSFNSAINRFDHSVESTNGRWWHDHGWNRMKVLLADRPKNSALSLESSEHLF